MTLGLKFLLDKYNFLGFSQKLRYKHYNGKTKQRWGGGGGKDMKFLGVLEKQQVDFPGG